MRLFVAVCLIACVASSAIGQPVWNLTAGPVALRDGPGEGHLLIGQIAPGQMIEVSECIDGRRWCLVSTDRDFGWIDTAVLPVPAPVTLPPPVALPVLAPPEVTVTPIPGGAPRPLPQAILDAVPNQPAAPGPAITGIRMPTLLSMTEPTFNVSDGQVNLRTGPGTDFAVIGVLEPGTGGILDTCSTSEQWCRVVPGDGSAPGWVRMLHMGLRRL